MFPRLEQHCFGHHIPESIEDGDFESAYNYLRENGADLRRGDLIFFDQEYGYRNNGVAIFDGDNIIELSIDIDPYGELPSQFHVIEDNVSINYWKEIDDLPGIAHNDIVWFNHKLITNYNLCFGPIEDNNYAIYALFNYMNQSYRIIFDFESNFNQEDITKCRYLLESKEPIVFGTESYNYYHSMNNYTLFIKL